MLINFFIFFKEQNAVPVIQVENLKTDLKAGVDDLKHPEDIDHDALKMVMDFRSRRDQIEANVKQEVFCLHILLAVCLHFLVSCLFTFFRKSILLI